MNPVITIYGTKIWYANGVAHRLDGPAAITNLGDEYWYRNGAIHRLDGPAIVYIDGRRYWHWLEKDVTEQQHSRISNLRFFTKKVKI